MTATTTKVHNKEQKEHSPFLIRKVILFLGFFVAMWSGYFLENAFAGLCAYILTVTICDVFSHHILKLRSSRFVVEEKLLSIEKTTPKKLDRYHTSRKNIRVLSFAVACLSQLLFESAEMFVACYVMMTWCSSFFAWFQLDIEGPKSVHVRPLSDREIEEYRSKQHDEVTLGLLGSGSYASLGRRE